MFSGAKHKLKRWRERKTSAKITSTPRETFPKIVAQITQQLLNLKIETGTVIEQLNKQVSALNEINEDATAVTEKITLLTENAKAIEKGQQDSNTFASLFEYVESLYDEIDRENTEIDNLRREANSLFNENKKLRTELQIFQDHHERAELRAVELEIQVEHLKFMTALPPDYLPFFGTEEDNEAKEEEKFSVAPKVSIPFLEDDFPQGAGCYILSVLEKMDLKDNSRLKILFDLIQSYIRDEAYDIAIPLLKTTLEDLLSKYAPHEKTLFTMMEVLAIVYNITQRWTDAVEIEKEILQVRKESMAQDKIGLARTLSSLAVLYGKVGKEKAARNFCRQALDLKNKAYGDCHPETAKELHNMGILYFMDDKCTKAIDCLQATLRMLRKSQNRSAFHLARAQANLALLYRQDDQLYEAKCVFNSTSKFLRKQLEKLVEEDHVQIEEILTADKQIDHLPNCKNKNEIQKLLNLLSEVTEESKSVSHAEAGQKNIETN